MSYVLSTPAMTSPMETLMVWPWFEPITAFVPFIVQLRVDCIASAGSPPSSPPHAATAAPRIVVPRNCLRVTFIGSLLFDLGRTYHRPFGRALRAARLGCLSP